jgi:hypothetical protein
MPFSNATLGATTGLQGEWLDSPKKRTPWRPPRHQLGWPGVQGCGGCWAHLLGSAAPRRSKAAAAGAAAAPAAARSARPGRGGTSLGSDLHSGALCARAARPAVAAVARADPRVASGRCVSEVGAIFAFFFHKSGLSGAEEPSRGLGNNLRPTGPQSGKAGP